MRIHIKRLKSRRNRTVLRERQRLERAQKRYEKHGVKDEITKKD